MTDLNDVYDVEYSIEEECDSVFYERDTKDDTSKVLKITQSLSLTLKNLKLLRKNGLLSRWNYFRILFNKKEEESHLLGALSLLMLVGTSLGLLWLLLNVSAEKSTLLPFLSIATTLGGGIFTSLFLSVYSRTIFKNNLPEKFRKKFSYISIPESNKDLYELVQKTEEYKLNHSEEEALFNLAQKYPHEANEQINKLMKLKDKVPVDEKDSDTALDVFDDTDKMLDELFAMRDSEESKQVLKDVETILKAASHRKKIEELGVSMEELAEVSDFLKNAKAEKPTDSTSVSQTSRISEIVENMNTAGEALVGGTDAEHGNSKTTVVV